MAISGGDGSIILTTKVDETGLKKGLDSMKKLGATAGKAFLAIGAAATTATVAITKMAVSAYAEFEQLAGGVEKIFNQANIAQIMEDANNAFMELNMSVNDYLRTMNDIGATFSATMGDQKGYDTARQGLLAISDYASGTGKNIDLLSEKFTMITRSASSYQSIADQFSGILPATSADFLAQAKAAGFLSNQYTKLTEVPIAEYQQAVTQMLSKGVYELGLAGNTAREAATTISGSLAMTKASWQNLLTAMSGGGDLDIAINNFVYSLERFTANIVPVIERTLLGLGQAIQRTLPQLIQVVVSALLQSIPMIAVAVYNMIMGLFKGIVAGIKALFTGGSAQIKKQVSSIGGGGGFSSGGISSGGSSGGASSKGSDSSGGKGSTKKGKSPEEEQIDAEIKAIQDKIKALQKENKQINKNDKANQKANKKQLASFDDITTLGSNQISEADTMIDKNNEEIDQLQEQLDLLRDKKQALQDVASASESGGGGISMPEIGEIGGGEIGGGGIGGSLIQDFSQQIDAELAKIMAIAGASLLAIGLLLMFFGHPFWGISFIIAGAVTMVKAMQEGEKLNLDEITNGLATIMGIAGGALLALGIILLWIGGVIGKGVAIGMIIAGASLIVSAVASKAAFSPKDIAGWLATILGIAAGALLALGIILCMVGSTPLGVGMIIAGSASLVSAVALNYNEVTNKVANFLKDNSGLIVGISLALLVLGIILCCVGVITPLSIGLIAAGAVGLATEIALNWGNVKNSITNFLKDNSGLIVGISLALLVLGIILCCVGVVTPLSIGLIVVGATGLVTGIVLNWTAIKKSISNFLKENQGLIVGVSLALLVLGIILCCTGVALPLGIGLIVVGAAGLATEVALNWDYIKNKTVETFNNIMDWVETWGLLILGIILVVSGVGIPLGIALMIKGGANLTEAQDPLWTAIVDKVKEIWGKVKEFWNTYIAPIFTAKWWADLGKRALNGLIGIVEKGLNFLIDKINSFIGSISSVVGVVGDVIGQNWSIPKIPKVKIPRLAQGAVIPPNREFLAVLGDQKHGTNIEAPLQTIVDAMNVALAQNGNGGQTTKEEHYYLNETELMSIVYKLVKGGERLRGSSLISGGAY